MWKTFTGCSLVLLTIILLSGSAIADGQQDTFSVIDTRQGAIKCNVKTGQCWLLDTSGDVPTWQLIRESTDEPIGSSSILRVDDIEWKVLIDDAGQATGVQVLKIKSEVAFKGLIEGDVVTGVNNDSVSSISDLRRLLRLAVQKGQPVKLSVRRDGKEIIVELEAGQD